MLSKPYGSRDFRSAAEMRKSCGKFIGKQKGRGFNLCVAPSPRNQVSRISDGAGKGLRIIKDRESADRGLDSCLIRLQTGE